MAGRRRTVPKKLDEALAAAPKYRRESKSQPPLVAKAERLGVFSQDAEAPDPYDYERQLMDVLYDARNRAKRYSEGGGRGSAAAGAAPLADGDLLGKMAQRLKVVEGKYARAKEELGRRAGEIEILKMQNEQLSQAHEQGMINVVKTLTQENKDLSAEVEEMKAFLAEYGLSWVGSKGKSAGDSNGGAAKKPSRQSLSSSHPKDGLPPKNPADGHRLGGIPRSISPGAVGSSPTEASHTNDPEGCPYPLDDLLQKIKDLNLLVTEGKGLAVKRGGGAGAGGAVVLARHETLDLTFFRDGLLVRRGPLRPYASARCRSFLRDLWEGFFPAELQQAFPDGVVLDARDRRGEEYAAAAAAAEAQRAAGAPRGLAGMGGAELALGVEGLLRRLPNSVIKNGNVISVRNDIAERLKGPAARENNGGVARAEVAAAAAAAAETAVAGGGGGGEGRTARIQVRSPDGAEVLVASLGYHATIGQLKEMAAEKWGLDANSFDLRTAFPANIFNEVEMTLETAGLIPNANMIAKMCC